MRVCLESDHAIGKACVHAQNRRVSDVGSNSDTQCSCRPKLALGEAGIAVCLCVVGDVQPCVLDVASLDEWVCSTVEVCGIARSVAAASAFADSSAPAPARSPRPCCVACPVCRCLSSLAAVPEQAVPAAGCKRSADADKRKHESNYLRKLFHDVFLLFDLMTVL